MLCGRVAARPELEPEPEPEPETARLDKGGEVTLLALPGNL